MLPKCPGWMQEGAIKKGIHHTLISSKQGTRVLLLADTALAFALSLGICLVLFHS